VFIARFRTETLQIRKLGKLFPAMTTSKRIERLRNKLLERGEATNPRIIRPVASPELSALAERVRPFAEVMYLVLAADQAVTERERNVLRGALRSLTDGALSTAAMDDMLRDFAQSRARDGVDVRLDTLASTLYRDRSDARLALGLATAAADADRGIGPEERELINALGERLGISSSELNAMLYDASTAS
jgi:tellurite resistance protein